MRAFQSGAGSKRSAASAAAALDAAAGEFQRIQELRKFVRRKIRQLPGDLANRPAIEMCIRDSSTS